MFANCTDECMWHSTGHPDVFHIFSHRKYLYGTLGKTRGHLGWSISYLLIEKINLLIL